MIVTLTPNPSLDRTLEVTALRRGHVVRATGVEVDPGGKGANVSRALHANGVPTRAVLPIGGRDGDHLRDALADLGIEVVAVPVAGTTRTNISLVEPDATVTKVNAPGPQLTAAEFEHLGKAAVDALGGAGWLACCGSLPPGAPADLFAAVAAEAHAVGARVAVDTSGATLDATLAAGPDLVKPNVHELAAVTGRHLATVGDAIDAAEVLRERGAGTVVVSLGPDGALLIGPGGPLHGTSAPIAARSAVGAGDALVAGLLAALDDGDPTAALRAGIAFGTAAARLPGTQMPGPDDLDLDAVGVGAPDVDRPLTEPGGHR